MQREQPQEANGRKWALRLLAMLYTQAMLWRLLFWWLLVQQSSNSHFFSAHPAELNLLPCFSAGQCCKRRLVGQGPTVIHIHLPRHLLERHGRILPTNFRHFFLRAL